LAQLWRKNNVANNTIAPVCEHSQCLKFCVIRFRVLSAKIWITSYLMQVCVKITLSRDTVITSKGNKA